MTRCVRPSLALSLVLVLVLGSSLGAAAPEPPPPIAGDFSDPRDGTAFGFVDPDEDGKEVLVYPYHDGSPRGAPSVVKDLGAWSPDSGFAESQINSLVRNPAFWVLMRHTTVAELEAGLEARRKEASGAT